jgi:hypothetical protein
MADTGAKISTRFLTSDKNRSVGARLIMTTLNPVTGTAASANQTIRFKFPSQRRGSYMDFQNSFIKYTVKSSETVNLSSIGCGGFIGQAHVRSGGSTLSSNTNYPVWRSAMTKLGTPTEYLKRDGAIMQGTDTTQIGQVLTKDVEQTFTDPLQNLGSLFQVSAYVPCMAQALELDLVLAGNTDNFIYKEDGVSGDPGYRSAATVFNAHMNAAGGLVFTDIEIYLAIVEVNEQTHKEIVREHSAIFKYLCNNVQCYTTTIAQSSRSSYNLGCSLSSVNTLHVTMRAPRTVSGGAKNSIFLRGGLNNVRLMIDGSIFQFSQGIDARALSVVKAWERIAGHHLSETSITGISDSAVDYDAQDFILSIDLESMSSRSETMRSGYNLSNSVVQLLFDWGAGTSPATGITVDIFVMYDSMISCNVGMDGLTSWEATV